VSNYSWNGTAENEFIFEKMIELLGKPEITFLIYANPEVRAARIRQRNPQDPDLVNTTVRFSETMYGRITGFLEKYGFKYHTVDTSHASIEESLNRIHDLLKNDFPDRF
jgi:thymidylate kinase